MNEGQLIGTSGGIGKGETTITERIKAALSQESILVLQQDYYYKDLPYLPLDEYAKDNHCHPDSLDTPLLIEHLCPLLELMGIKIFVDPDAGLRFIRRLGRDRGELDRTLESGVRQ